MNTYRIPVFCYTAVDLASSKERTASRTVVGTGCIDARKNFYLLDYWIRLGSNPFDTMKEISRQAEMYKSRKIGIEENRYEAFLDMYKSLTQDDNLGGEFIEMRISPIRHYGSDSNKEDRIIARLEHKLKSKRFFVRLKHDLVSDHIADFPQCDFLDLLDMIEMLLDISKPPARDTRILESNEYRDSYDDSKSYDPLTMSWNVN